ncbi:MAG: tRNA (adenosine(37)-N6)-dimethylallyltransferase MiaA [Alphaproteobacteria bacterium]|nr:tRNA (adenosine(37)-N6)-dimethylallyltransferase MiaA [Alphaproteobacteria bacterium]
MPQLIPIIITGPTAGGKSDIAEQVCDALDGVIINADSLQVYKGLPELTAQPVIQEGRHVLYNYFEPDDKCDVVRWVGLVQEATAQAQSMGKQPIIVGGTGFYLKVLMEGIAPIPDVPNDVMQRAEAIIQTQGIDALYQDLKAKDPNLPKHLRVTDIHRTMRAWTVLEATGKPLQEWYQLQQPMTDRFIKVLCSHDREILYHRINQRFVSMWKNGITNEVQVFRTTYHDINNNYAAKAIGFDEVEAYLDGRLTESLAIEQAQTKTRHYAKRQLTWSRHQFDADIVLDEPQFNVDKLLMFCHNSGM